MAISKFDQFDFLIDIVPREELKPAKRQVHINPFKTNGIYHKVTIVYTEGSQVVISRKYSIVFFP